MKSLKWIWSDKHLTLDTKLHIYQTLALSVLLYATDTWTLLSADVRTLDAFHQKCLRRLLGIRWYDRVRNNEVLQRTSLTSPSHRRTSVFGHVACDDTPANMSPAPCKHNSRPPESTWCCPPGRSRNKWLNQLWNDSTHPIGLLETCCQPRTWWCNNVTALAVYAIVVRWKVTWPFHS